MMHANIKICCGDSTTQSHNDAPTPNMHLGKAGTNHLGEEDIMKKKRDKDQPSF